ncbi:ATP-dependent helicase [Sanguibacter suaedae]|uniref:ATP-dependent helicase n=1 Tax=Sanguibacter suaedae TaxID=2795737 RepID=A0A934ICN0_9MICO|nr:ATP-dependent helicase [Sanguibacter suaedae]MBI9115508.1 ATP-dependent helicase [Sanguibacter suaedae]
MPQPSDPGDAAAPLDRLGDATRAWFTGAFDAPTPAQSGAWEAVGAGRHALVVAPTGSGKTLAAFLWALDRLLLPDTPGTTDGRRCRVVYVSPLKALAADVERNLRSPLVGIRQAAGRLGLPLRDVTVGTRTGDTPTSERRRFATAPPDILITTPESLFLVLTSAARAGLTGVETVIVDEIHAVAGTKRGAHLAVSLERLDALVERPVQRIGLSATVTPVDAVAEFLAGARAPQDGGREVTVVQPPSAKRIDVDVVVPVPDLGDLRNAHGESSSAADATDVDLTGQGGGRQARPSVWPHVEERVVDLVSSHRSTLVFTNSRRGAERLTSRVNEVWAERQGDEVSDPGDRRAAEIQAQSGASAGVPAVLARAHHGSMSRAERTRTETELKEGRLPAVVSTSSLELGIDMGAIDLVVQIGAPPSVASGLQRIGRAGHQVGAVSHGVVFPLHRGDLAPSTVIAARMRTGEIEALRPLRNPLDVLAQQIVAMVAVDDWDLTELATVLRRSQPFTTLGDGTLRAVLDMLAGRYPSEDFGELRARIVWDRVTDRLSARPGALRLAVTSGGTIPDRGLYGVFLSSAAETDAPAQRGGRRVGELDEEMVYESRIGDTFTLGSSTWRIEDITHDRVLVSPAPGVPGRLPFWKGDSPGRPAELGRAVGAWLRAAAQDVEETRRRARPSSTTPGPAPTGKGAALWDGLDPWAADNLRAYLAEQLDSTGVVPDDRTLVVERFRDELGDWRVVIHSPYGAKVHAPWALVLAARVRERFGIDAATMHSDDGIVLRLPDLGDAPGTTTDGADGLDLGDLLVDPQSVRAAVQDELGGSALFGARFREAASRALLLPRRRPDRRQPLWQQRQRSAQLLSVASGYPDFPIVLEAVRECLQDDFDVDSLTTLMEDLDAGRTRIVEVVTGTPSPFAQSLLLGYTAQFIYDGDAPLAERRAAALTLDPELLAELLGQEGASQIADLLDPDAVLRTERELAGLTEERAARHGEDVWEALRRTGPLTSDEIRERSRPGADVLAWLTDLERERRVVQVRLAGVPDGHRWAAIEDAGRLRDALGVALPTGVPETYTEPVPDPLGDLVRRYARTHGPFTANAVAERYGLGTAVVSEVLRRLTAAGTLVTGRLRPESLGGTGVDFCDIDVLRTLRRRSLAALRAEVEPVEQVALGAFLPRWQGVGTLRGTGGLYRAVEQLAGAQVPLSALESSILPARVVDYSPAMLDELTTSGEVLWCGHHVLPGSRGAKDGVVSLHLSESAAMTLPPSGAVPDDALQATLLETLEGSGGYFLHQIAAAAGVTPAVALEGLWGLVWAGLVTNDGLGPLRVLLGGRSTPRGRTGGRARSVRSMRPPRPGLGLGGVPGASVDHGGGRWSALPGRDLDPTRRAHALAAGLLDRHGVVTRALGPAENLAGGFGDVYRVLAALETAGHVRRGYFVEHLGGAQFALPGAVDELRTVDSERRRGASPTSLCLAATDPANPYGASVGWPGTTPTVRTVGDTPREAAASEPDATPRATHRPGRKAGAHVVLVDGALTLYLERGGRSLLTFTDDPEALVRAATTLGDAVRDGRVGRTTVQKIDGRPALDGAAGDATPAPLAALRAAGFSVTPSGVRPGQTAGARPDGPHPPRATTGSRHA